MGGSIPDSVMDDLFNLLGEDQTGGGENQQQQGQQQQTFGNSSFALDDLFGGLMNSGGGVGGRKRKISDSWFNLSDHEHHELFGQIAENFSIPNHSPNHFNHNNNSSFKFSELGELS